MDIGSDSDGFSDKDSGAESIVDDFAGGQKDEEEEMEEEEAAVLTSDTRQDMLEQFYNQTIGSVFTWSLETTIIACVHFCVYLLAEALLSDEPGGVLVAKWCSYNVLVLSFAMLGVNALIAFAQREPGIFSRHFMMCTMAYCGVVSSVTTVFSAVLWKALATKAWRDIFLQSDESLTSALMVAIIIANNMQWVLSLILTYSCTPFGQNNSAFFTLPVAAALSLFLIVVNEIATHHVLVCQSVQSKLLTYGFVNGAIISSLLGFVLSAVEFDPRGLFPGFMHSSLYSRVRFDVYALLHGMCLFCIVLGYGAIATLCRTTFYATFIVLGFITLVTLIQSVDVTYIASLLMHVDDEEEKRIRALQEALAVSFIEARNIHRATMQRPHQMFGSRYEAAKAPPMAPMAPMAQKAQTMKQAKKTQQTKLSKRKQTEQSDVFHPDVSFDEPVVAYAVEPEVFRTHAERFKKLNKRRKMPTAISIFPNIPVSMKRTVN